MKKRIKIFAGALAAVLILSASVAYALSAEPEAAKASGREQVLDTVSVCDESVPLTESTPPTAVFPSRSLRQKAYSLPETQ